MFTHLFIQMNKLNYKWEKLYIFEVWGALFLFNYGFLLPSKEKHYTWTFKYICCNCFSSRKELQARYFRGKIDLLLLLFYYIIYGYCLLLVFSYNVWFFDVSSYLWFCLVALFLPLTFDCTCFISLKKYSFELISLPLWGSEI